MSDRKAYPSDLRDAEWDILEPLIPAISPEAVTVKYTRREIVNGILYVLRSGWTFRLVPHDAARLGARCTTTFVLGATMVPGTRSKKASSNRCDKKKAEMKSQVLL
jgi:putative transposase of IS4/5 family DUF4096